MQSFSEKSSIPSLIFNQFQRSFKAFIIINPLALTFLYPFPFDCIIFLQIKTPKNILNYHFTAEPNYHKNKITEKKLIFQ
jgi:hypothetical protein